ncbi:MAG: glutamate formimidoyltransferase [Elusimicrobiaceae bacterium]|nr:glutamate formimidoyltransferase [Elusimicrobiaceae bacterium]
MKLLEAVPNVSEGKNPFVLHELEEVLRSIKGITLLGIDSNPSANRTVFTFIGSPEAMQKALPLFILRACDLIDMRTQQGAHPRLGAVDVCPLVPLQNISLQECADLAKQIARQISDQIALPIYLYEAAACNAERRNLAFIRRGEYESLPNKLKILPPDFGPSVFTESVAKTGACVMGARNFLIAFNINLNTQDPAPARQIAARIRQSGGGIKGLKAIGWYMENFARAQVSCNIIDFISAPLHIVYQQAQLQAQNLGVQITGSELVGLIPLEALLAVGRHCNAQEKSTAALVASAAEYLNLSEVKPFIAQEQILEVKAGLAPLI